MNQSQLFIIQGPELVTRTSSFGQVVYIDFDLSYRPFSLLSILSVIDRRLSAAVITIKGKPSSHYRSFVELGPLRFPSYPYGHSLGI